MDCVQEAELVRYTTIPPLSHLIEDNSDAQAEIKVTQPLSHLIEDNSDAQAEIKVTQPHSHLIEDNSDAQAEIKVTQLILMVCEVETEYYIVLVQ